MQQPLRVIIVETMEETKQVIAYILLQEIIPKNSIASRFLPHAMIDLLFYFRCVFKNFFLFSFQFW